MGYWRYACDDTGGDCGAAEQFLWEDGEWRDGEWVLTTTWWDIRDANQGRGSGVLSVWNGRLDECDRECEPLVGGVTYRAAFRLEEPLPASQWPGPQVPAPDPVDCAPMEGRMLGGCRLERSARLASRRCFDRWGPAPSVVLVRASR